jgi:hypothetical protein
MTLIALFACLALTARAALITNISTDGGDPTKTNLAGSVEGGTRLYIRGSGLETYHSSDVKVKVGGKDCEVEQYYLRPNNIQCLTPAMESSATEKDLHTIEITVDTASIPLASTVSTATTYSTDNTPRILSISPGQETPGSTLQFYGSWRTSNANNFEDFRLNSKLMTLDSDDNTFAWTSFLYATLGDNSAGDADLAIRLEGNLGTASYRWTAKQATLDGTQYLAKTLAEVNSVNLHEASKAGGLQVEITGKGFTSSATVSVEGNDCVVDSVSYTTILCTVGSQTSTQAGSLFPGNAGLRRLLWNDKRISDKDTLVDSAADVNDIIAAPETLQNIGDSFVERVTGLFKAPCTGSYRFFLSSDDSSEVYLSTDSDPANKAKIVEMSGWCSYRDMLTKSTQRSEFISMTADSLYYLEAWHQNSGGATHFTLGLEAECASDPPNKMPEVQVVSIAPSSIVRGVQRLSFNGTPTGGTLKLLYKTTVSYAINWPSTGDYWTCGDILNAMRDFGIQRLLCSADNTSGLLYDFTFDYAATDTRSLIIGITAGIEPSSVTTSTVYTQTASAALQGTYTLTWKGTTTAEIDVAASAGTIEATLNADHPVFKNELMVAGSASGDGVEITLIFGGPLNTGSVELATVTSTIVGGPEGTVPTVTVTRTLAASNHQFWFLAPSEVFRTAEDVTQLTVAVDGQPALCRGNCAFAYLVSSPTITSMTDGSTVNFTGTDLIANTSAVKVTIGGAACAVTAATTTSVSCTKTSGVVGTHTPKVYYELKGLAVYASGVSASVTFALTITSVSPATGAIGGGTLLTIVGTGFKPSLNSSYAQTVTIDGSACEIQSSSGTEITCITSKQTVSSTITVEVESQTTASDAFLYDPNISPIITSHTPDYASTIVTTEIVLTGTLLDSTTSDEVTVFVGTVECYVFSASATEVKCNLNGGPKGTATLVLTVPGRGNSVVEDFPLKYEVSSITPQTGSPLGGTLLTITGKGFSTLTSQTLIQLSDKIYCEIEGTPTIEQLQCRTPAQGSQSSSVTVAVLGRIQELADCSDCSFAYSSSVQPTVSSLSASSGTAYSSLEINGSGFGTDASLVHVTIGTEATVTGVNDSQITVTVSNWAAGSYAVKVTVDDKGTASGSLTYEIKIDVTAVTPSQVSQGGADLVLTGTGFQQGLTVTVGSTACTVTSVTLEQVECKVAAYSSDETAHAISITQSSSTFTCSSLSACGVSFLASLTFQLTSATLTSGTLSIIGTGFTSTQADIKVTIGDAGYCVVTAATTTQIDCSAHLAAGSQAVRVHIAGAGYASGSASVTGTFALTSASGSSSYAGQATVTIAGQGLSPSSVVKVCGRPCKVTEALYTSLTCESPVLATKYSQDTYDLQSMATDITEGLTSTTAASGYPLSNTADDVASTYFKSNDSPCSISLDAGSGRQVRLGGMRIKPAEDTVTTYTKLKGSYVESSDDATTWTKIYTFSAVYEGWNYWKIPSDESYEARYFRFTGSTDSLCRLSEIRFSGVNLLDSSATSETCSVEVTDGSTTLTTTSVTYSTAVTPVITEISPKYGTVLGGTDLVFTGTNLSEVESITIDNVLCTNLVASSTSVTCTTAAKDDYDSSGLVVRSAKGLAVTSDTSFLYADKWSERTTWRGEVPPKDGETVQIPKGMTILLDTPTAKLELLEIEGALIALDEADLTLDAKWIFVKGGTFQVGTEDAPFTHRFTLTLHGDRSTPEIPIYGNKVLANREGILDLHGQARTKTWTSLASTVNVGATTLTVQDSVDWTVGEQIVVASTSFEHTEAEVRTITAVSGTTLTVSEAFAYKHYAATETYGSKTIDMRAEVGLLTRNVRVRGSDQGLDVEHGATIMNFSHGDETTQARLSYIEVFNAGQASSLGRYPIHFHLIGTVHKSYVKGCSVHHTFNRAITIHGVHYLRVTDNVTYHTKGHTIFVEDAIETKNLIENNLIVSVRRSWSLLNTDTSPAGMWITNPNNFFRNNHVAGGDAYGYWFDLKDHPTGPSYTCQICPTGEKLGEFNGNVAHSMVKYGLRLFHVHIPLTDPCGALKDDSLADPWSANPSVTATYENFTAYKCGRDGAIGEKMGDVRWVNFKVADNKLAGLEMTYTTYSKPWETALISDALIIGNSANSDGTTAGSIGLITPQTDGLQVEKVYFYNFDSDQFPLGDASHSFKLPTRDTGARLTKLSQLSFTGSHKKIAWGVPATGFFEISDASLTGTANAYVAAYWPHLLDSSCTDGTDTYNSVVCDGTKKIRRVQFSGIQNINTFYFKPLTVRRTSGTDIPLKPAARRFLTTEPDYLWSSIEMQRGGQYKSPSLAWNVPFVLGYEYSIHWGDVPMDWTQFKIGIDSFEADDEWVHLHLNFTDHREHFNVKRGSVPSGTDTSAADYVDPTIIPLSETALTSTMVGGTARFDNVTNMEFEVMVNTVEDDIHKGAISVEGLRCYGDHCTLADTEEPVVVEDFVRKWSDPLSWDTGIVPVDGERVTILPEWDMLLDTNTAVLSHLEVNGKLTFDTTQSVTLNSYIIHIRRGSVVSGSLETPVPAQISHQIVLHGTYNSTAFAFDPYIEVVNKAMVVTGQLNMYGAPRDTWKRLCQNVKPGENVIFVEKAGWRAGDEIVISSSGFDIEETETAKIIAVSLDGIDMATEAGWAEKEATKKFGKYSSEVFPHNVAPNDSKNIVKLTLDRSLKYYHAGTAMLVSGNTIDTRAEVGLLTSNTRISGVDNGWACNIVVADYIDYNTGQNPLIRSGVANLYNVEIDNCGQKDSIRAGIRFEKNTKPSAVVNSIVKRSMTYAVYLSEAANVTLKGNVFYKALRFGVIVMTATTTLIDSNLVVYTKKRDGVEQKFDKPTAFLICPEKYSQCGSVTVTNNVAAGYDLIGFNYGSYPCGGTSSASNNLAHTGTIGFLLESFTSSCDQVDSVTAYFNSDSGVLGSQNAKEVRFKGIKAVENYLGFIAQIGVQGDSGLIVRVSDSVFAGQTVHSYCDPTKCSDLACISRHGIGTGTFGSSKGFTLLGKLMFPLTGMSKDPAFTGEFRYSNIYLGNFNNSAACSTQQTAIVSNENSPDFISPSVFTNVIVENVPEGSLFYIHDPKEAWANIEDCNEFPCTAPRNVIIRDTDGSLSNNATSTYLLPNNPGVALKDSCTFVAKSNGYVCRKTVLHDFDYSILLFESLDSDKMDRTFSPIYVTSEDFVLGPGDIKYYNKLNTFMDHVWDGFYTGQKRMSRFPSILPMNRFMNITATGTWPNNMRYHLVAAEDFNKPSVITVSYQHPYTIALYKNGVKQSPLQYAQDDLSQVQLSSPSGTYKWFFDTRKLQFNIRAGDIIELRTIDSLQLTVRMDMTTEEFFANNGVTNFIDRLAASLGIPTYRIRVAQVRSGSTIVEASIEKNDYYTSSEDAVAELKSIDQAIAKSVADGTLNLNAPILSVSSTVSTTTTASSTSTNVPTEYTPDEDPDPSVQSDILDDSSDDDSDDDNKKLPAWGIAAVACGGALLVVGIGVLIYCMLRRPSKIREVGFPMTPLHSDEALFQIVAPEPDHGECARKFDDAVSQEASLVSSRGSARVK